MVKKNESQEDEIDLGNLFRIIGQGIKNLFIAVGKFFLYIFHFIILLLIFLKRNTIKLGLAVLIGIFLGYVLEYVNPPKYASALVLTTNYGSGVQLYKQIDYLNELVMKKDTISLARALQMNPKEVSQLKSFDVEAYQPKKNLYKLYDEYLRNTDTIYTRGFSFADFKKRMDEINFHYHEVVVKSNLKTIFRNVSVGLKNLVENDYYKYLRDLKTSELNQKLHTLKKNLVQIDSLRSRYKKVALNESQKSNSSSVLEISQSPIEDNRNDIELFKTSGEILDQIEKLNNEIIISQNIINIISDFDEVGVLDKKITGKKYFQLGVLFGVLMLVFILVIQLNKYLDNYKKII